MRHWIKTGSVAAGIAIAVVLLAGASGCVLKQSTDVDVDQGQGISGPSTPGSPSPAPCDVASLDLGTAGDAVEVPRGGSVTLVIAYRGAQGVELPASCTANLAPRWTAVGVCVLIDSASTPRLRAPADAPLGSTCTALARLGSIESRTVTITVVAQ